MRRAVPLAAVLLIVLAVLAAYSCSRDAPEGAQDAASQIDQVEAAPEAEDDAGRRRVTTESAPDAEPTPAAAAAEAEAFDALPAMHTSISPPWVRLDVPKHEIEGRVIDPSGAPVADVKVHLVSTWLAEDERLALLDGAGAFSHHVDSTARTAGDGTFRLECVDGGERRLVAGRLHLPRALRDVEPGAFHEIVLPAEPPSAEILVLDPSGAPVAGADVSYSYVLPWSPSPFSSQALIPRSVQSDDDGLATLAGLPVGTLRIAVRPPPGRGVVDPVRVEIPATGGERTTITLREAIRVAGRVVDDETGHPVAGASVQQDLHTRRITTDTEGRFEVYVAHRPHTFSAVTVEADGYAREMGSISHGEAPDGTYEECVIRLERESSVTLRCVDADGEPMEHVAVFARTTAFASAAVEGVGLFLFEDVGAQRSGKDGRVTIANLHAGDDIPLRVLFRLRGVQVLDHSSPALGVGEQRDLGDIVVVPGRTLSGRVTSAAGEVVAGALVHVVAHDATAPRKARHGALAMAMLTREGRHADTGADGVFRLRGLAPGLWDVLVSRPAPGLLHEGVQVSTAEDPPLLELRMPRSITVTGRVLDADGDPVAGGAVLYPLPAPVELHAQDAVEIDAEGRFEIPGFAPDATPFDVHVMAGPESAQVFTIDPRGGTVELRME